MLGPEDITTRVMLLVQRIVALEQAVVELTQAHAQTAASVQATIDALPEKTAAKIQSMPPGQGGPE